MSAYVWIDDQRKAHLREAIEILAPLSWLHARTIECILADVENTEKFDPNV